MPQKKKNSMSLVPKEVINKEVQAAEKDLEELEQLPVRIKKLKMTSDKNYQIVMEEGKEARNVERAVLAKQKKILDLFKAAAKEVKDLFRPMLDACTEVLELVDLKRNEYDLFLEEEREEEQRRLDEEAEAEQKRMQRNANARAKRASSEAEAKEIRHSVEEVETKEVEIAAPVKISGVSRAKIWDFEVLDEGEVPESVCVDGEELPLWERDFFRANLKTARSHLDPDGDGQPIPGVRFFQKDGATRYGRS